MIDLNRLIPVRKGEEFILAFGFAARSVEADEPLVYVVDGESPPSPGETYRASYNPASGWGEWTDYFSLHGSSVFYCQGIMDQAADLAAPASGDYDGDGRTDIAVFRPSMGLWAVKGISRICFGTSGDVPVT